MRWLAAASFAKTYPKELAELEKHGVQVHKLDKPFLHARYFVVDGSEAYLGSQNFDWRSLQHIEELGVRFPQPDAVREFEDIFETDWSGTVQLLTCSSVPELSDALVHASERGVEVQLLLSDWELRPRTQKARAPG